MRRFDELILLLSEYFNKHEIPYSIIGGVAILFQGRFRTTEDIDFLIVHDELQKGDFISFCKKNGLSIDKYDLEVEFENGTHITIMDFPNRIRIDLKAAKSSWDKGAIRNAEQYTYEGYILRIASPEYLIVNKLYKGGKVDLEDAYSVFYQNQDRINLDLLKNLANMVGVEKELRKFLLNIT